MKKDKNIISFDELTAMIKQYADGSKKQDNPQIVWIDNIAEIIKYTDVCGFAMAMGKPDNKDSERSFFNSISLPSPYLNYRLDFEGNIIEEDKHKMNDWHSPYIPINIDEAGNIKTQLFIHSLTAYEIKSEWMFIDAGLMIFKKFDIPVLMLYPLSFKDYIKTNWDTSEYEELYCCASSEDYAEKWLVLAEKTVYNFYLDFLKASPWKHISSRMFDPRYKDITGFYATVCTPKKWEDASVKIKQELRLLATLIATSEKSVLKKFRDLQPVFNGNIIQFDKLDEILALVPEEVWQDWISTRGYDAFKVNPTLRKDSPRIDILKSYFCSSDVLVNMPDETVEALLKYHKLM